MSGGMTAQVLVSTSAGACVAATLGGTTIGPVVADSNGEATLELTDYGTWTLTASLDGDTASTTVAVDDVKQYSATLAFFTATINVTAPAGSIVTVSLSGATVNTHTATGSAVAVTVNQAGTYTIEAVDGSKNASTTATVSTSGQSVSVGVSFSVLPSGYTELEYIESSGTQWIDTEIVTGGLFRITGAFMQTQNASINAQTIAVVFGAGNNSVWDTFAITNYFSTNLSTFYPTLSGGSTGTAEGSSKHYKNNTITNNQKYTFDVCTLPDNFFVKIDGVSLTPSWSLSKSVTSSYHDGLFGNLPTGAESNWYHFVGRMYQLKMFNTVDNTELQHHFYPAKRNSDNVVGMYDVVSETFFTNAGTGTFTAGPEV